MLKLATRKYIWFWGDDDYYDLKQVLKVIKFVLSKKQNYEGFLPCFSYLSDKSFNSNKVLGTKNAQMQAKVNFYVFHLDQMLYTQSGHYLSSPMVGKGQVFKCY